MRSDTPPRISACSPPIATATADAEPERLALLGHHVRGRERADADERLVAERDLADVAEQDVEREADDPVDHRLRVLLHLERLALAAGTRAPARRSRSRRCRAPTQPSSDGRNGAAGPLGPARRGWPGAGSSTATSAPLAEQALRAHDQHGEQHDEDEQRAR